MGTTYYITTLAAFFTAAAFSFIITPLVKRFAFKIGAVDIPKDSRRMHKEPIARLGGLSIYIGFIFSTVFFLIFTWYFNVSASILGMLAGATIIVVLGIFDDIIALKAHVKLLVQVGAALITVLSGIKIDIMSILSIVNPTYRILAQILSVIITVVWLVGITNAVNFMDGLDGLAAGVSSISTITIMIIMVLIGHIDMAVMTAALAGGCVGFMPFNMRPAKIFMGDTGATFLGFFMAAATVKGLFNSYLIVSIAVPFLLLGLPIFDTIFTILRRLSAGRSPMSPDREHLHHRLVDLGMSQRQTVWVFYIITIIFSVSSVIMTSMELSRAYIFAAIAFTAMFVSVLLFERYVFKKAKKLKYTKQ